MTDYQGKRLYRSTTMTIPATPKKIFPLLCPVRELDWIEPWGADLTFSHSGLAEIDCVFTTDFRGHGADIVTCTRYEPPRRIDYLFVSPGHKVTRLSISLGDKSEENTDIQWSHTVTTLSPEGEARLERFEGEQYGREMQALEAAMGYYLKTGKMLTGLSKG